MISPPTPITDQRQASSGELGLPDDFIPVETFGVGANGVSLSLSGTTKFDIIYQTTDASIAVGDALDIYYSDDGEIWQTTDTSCILDTQMLCTFQSSQLGIFALGNKNITSI